MVKARDLKLNGHVPSSSPDIMINPYKLFEKRHGQCHKSLPRKKYSFDGDMHSDSLFYSL